MKSLLRSLSCALLLAMALLLCPGPAFARSLQVTRADMSTTVNTDGSITVVEQRTYDVVGAYNGFLWDVQQGTYQGREVRASVLWAGVVSAEGQTQLEEAYEGEPGTYELTDEGGYLQLKIFWPAENETVTLQVSYKLTNLVSRWADVGELYWQYVPADTGSEGEWLNVTNTVHLPVPDGVAITAGENVRAWGHGPIDGVVSFSGDSVSLYSPGVGSAEFLEIRLTFPQEWLADTRASGESRLESILAEEDQWVKDANARRRKARLIVYGFPGGMCLAGIGSVVAALINKRHRVLKGPKPQFTDTYYRDVPTNDHPAVLGMLYRDGRGDVADFSATLMRLADKGRVVLDAVWVEKEGMFGKTKREREWRLLERDTLGARSTDTRAGGKKIDDTAFRFLFTTVGEKFKHDEGDPLLGPSGEPYVLMSYFDEVAEKWPEAYQRSYGAWASAVRDAYNKRKFEASNEDDLLNGILGLGDFGLSIVAAIVGMFLGVPNLFLCIGLIVWFGAGVFIVMIDEDTKKITYTQEATDLRAKLEALKRWLKDFTRLEEAIPTDVVLWNRLLIMATVFGVAEEVVEQLKVYAPQLVENPAFSAYRWYGGGPDEEIEMPMSALTYAIGEARSTSASKLYHETSTFSVASSHDSSSGGGGGGFSGGGGGGFSGGGGRGGGF